MHRLSSVFVSTVPVSHVLVSCVFAPANGLASPTLDAARPDGAHDAEFSKAKRPGSVKPGNC
jgi:hypothetical protein